MHKLLASIKKECLLLIRDIGGIAILFIMPLVLVVTITLIQDSTFKTVSDTKVPVLLVNKDDGTVSKNIIDQLTNSDSFELITKQTEEEARDLVFSGDYQLAIVIPEKLSADLNKKVQQNVEGVMTQFMMEEGEEAPVVAKEDIQPKEVKLYFDPATQVSFKSAVKNGIDKMITKIEMQSVYKAFQDQMSTDGEASQEMTFDTSSFILFKEVLPKKDNKEILPNSVQHNVPAWTLFAIFFIIVPLSINIVKEKSQGTFVRLRTNPVSYATVLGGKTIVYLIVCSIQFVLMLLVGIYMFPAIGLPQLDVSGRIAMLMIVTVFAGLAAIGLGLLIGTIANTQEQSAPFGATFVVILAAMGGIWVPVFVMPQFMQVLANVSPMNWGLNAYYDVFLRNAGFVEIIPELILLLLFFCATTFVAIVYNEKKNAV